MKRKTLTASAIGMTALVFLAWLMADEPRLGGELSPDSAAVQPATTKARQLPTADPPDSTHLKQAATRDIMVSHSGLDAPTVLEPGVRYGRLADLPLPDALREKLHAELQRLKDTGSSSGGNVTHEFASVDDAAKQLRELGLGQVLGTLAITPTSLADALGDGYALVGAEASGKEIPGRGRAAYYQVWRKGASQWVELAEDQLDVLGGDGAAVTIDFHNEMIDGYPATMETLRDSQGAPLHNLQWWVKDRSFFMTTRNLGKDQALAAATRISMQLAAMPHDGWREPYSFDPENPAHRIVRARQTIKAPAPAGSR